ncbi:MAG: NAD(P)-binding domain-containing protein, partial [Phycisphaerales bacterium]
MRETDIVIIGAGPIGIELAVALKKAGMNHLHLEAGQVGATMQWWAPGTKYFSSPERIGIAGVPLIVEDE